MTTSTIVHLRGIKRRRTIDWLLGWSVNYLYQKWPKHKVWTSFYRVNCVEETKLQFTSEDNDRNVFHTECQTKETIYLGKKLKRHANNQLKNRREAERGFFSYELISTIITFLCHLCTSPP